MRIASFNVENLFDRAKALSQRDWSVGRPALEAHARLNALFQQPVYTPAIKDEILVLLDSVGLTRNDVAEFVRLRQNKGKLLRRPRAGGAEVVADGRGEWIGWVELVTVPVEELAMTHTAQVVAEVGPDILGVVEADNRIALKRFSDAGLIDAGNGSRRYPHVMVVDGNDDRGIDVGIMTRANFPLGPLRSHVDDVDTVGPVFSRDCPEYEVTTPSGERVLVLINHLKSKGFGGQHESNARRLRQARRVAQIYRRLRDEGAEHIVVLGDLNDTPDSAPLAPLLADTDLQDVATHPNFADGGRPGTFANGTKSGKIDYVLLSPSLFARTEGGAIFRKGVWGGKNGTLWEHYPTMTKAIHAASDHAVIYADISLP
jgi:endonuclease/exonuclease/phosphatase family metal-dependent hydrolase